MKPETVYLFTQFFPFGNQEAFIEKEIPVLASRFKKVVIFPLISEAGTRPLPDNVEVAYLFEGYRLNVLRDFLSKPLAILKVFIPEVFNRLQEYRHRKNLFFTLADKSGRAKLLERHLPAKHDAVFYTYWLADWVEILHFTSFKKKVPVISRAHGFDVFEERKSIGFIPFRKQHFETVTRVYSVSGNGARYLKNRYPEYAHKIRVSKLGVPDKGENPFNPGVFSLVTCSRVSPVKRLHLIPQILSFINIPVHWIHLGGGEGLGKLKSSCTGLPSNITCDFTGELKNTEILDFYRANPVNLFLNVSSSEGLPVSIMEAISFGIPVMATDVGGNSEIVNNETGFLVSKDFDPPDAAQKIMEFLLGPRNTSGFRIKVKEFWRENFQAEKVFNEFADHLIEESKQFRNARGETNS